MSVATTIKVASIAVAAIVLVSVGGFIIVDAMNAKYDAGVADKAKADAEIMKQEREKYTAKLEAAQAQNQSYYEELQSEKQTNATLRFKLRDGIVVSVCPKTKGSSDSVSNTTSTTNVDNSSKQTAKLTPYGEQIVRQLRDQISTTESALKACVSWYDNLRK